MYSIIYFSPTGNVLHLAQKLAKHLGPSNANISPLEFTEPDELKRDKHLVIIFILFMDSMRLEQ